jgi:hypothetical protein
VAERITLENLGVNRVDFVVCGKMTAKRAGWMMMIRKI